MDNNIENNEINIKKWTRGPRKTNYEYLKIWRETHQEQYLIEKNL